MLDPKQIRVVHGDCAAHPQFDTTRCFDAVAGERRVVEFATLEEAAHTFGVGVAGELDLFGGAFFDGYCARRG